MRDYFRAYIRALWFSLTLLWVAPPIIGLGLIGLWMHRAYHDGAYGSGPQFYTPVGNQWLWLAGLWLIGGWVIALALSGNGYGARDTIAALEALALGMIGFAAVISVVPWFVVWFALVSVLVIGLPLTVLDLSLRRIKDERRAQIAEQERWNKDYEAREP